MFRLVKNLLDRLSLWIAQEQCDTRTELKFGKLFPEMFLVMTDSWARAWSQNMSTLKTTTLTKAWWLFSLYLHSCCSHSEHRISVKRFVSLQFLNLTQSVGLRGRRISPSQGLYIRRTAQTQNKRRQRSVLWVWFEPTIPVFERAKIFHVLYRAATVIDKAWWQWIWKNQTGCLIATVHRHTPPCDDECQLTSH
jgi:hypothetical protein